VVDTRVVTFLRCILIPRFQFVPTVLHDLDNFRQLKLTTNLHEYDHRVLP